MDLELALGHVAPFDEPGTGHVTELGQRVEVQPLLNAPGEMHGVGGGVSERGGEDVVYYPDDPCGGSMSSSHMFAPNGVVALR